MKMAFKNSLLFSQGNFSFLFYFYYAYFSNKLYGYMPQKDKKLMISETFTKELLIENVTNCNLI